MKQLSPLDAAFVYQETGNQYMHVAGLYIYDPSTVPAAMRSKDVLGYKDIMKVTQRSLHHAPNLRRRLIRVPGDLDHPYWVEDEHFDIEFHMRHIALPKPGDWKQLCILAARLHARPLDMSRPLWETYIIENLDNIPGLPPGCFATLNKVHHAAIDGATGMAQMAAMHTLAPNENLLDREAQEDLWQPETEPLPGELMLRSYASFASFPFRAAEAMLRVAIGAERAFSRGEMAGATSLPPHSIFSKRVSPHRVFDARLFDLNEIKKIKNAVPGATINDVVLTICGGALRTYLENRGNLPEESLVALIPINVRSEEERDTGGNVVSSMTARIHTDIAHPKSRLRAVMESTKHAKSFIKAIGAREIVNLAGVAPAATAALGAKVAASFNWTERAPLPFNLTITNVPGPQIPLYSVGSRLVTTFGLGPNMHGQGLFIAVQSYAGILTIAFNACRVIMPDPESLAEAIQKSFDELREAALGETLRAPSLAIGGMTQARDAPKSQRKAVKSKKRKAAPAVSSNAAPAPAHRGSGVG